MSGQMINLSRAKEGARAGTQYTREDTIQNTVMSSGSNEHAKGKGVAGSRNLKYNEEDGFMRGARIAEKI